MKDFSLKRYLPLAVLLGTFTSFPIISYVREVYNDYNYPPLIGIVRYIAILIFGVSFISYALFLINEKSRPENSGVAQYFIPAFFAGIFLCCIYPIFSIDLFEYIIRGRILGIYNANPYVYAPVNFSKDILYDVIFWKDQPMIYGPVWAYLVTSAVSIAKDSIFLSQFLVKSILLIFHISLSYVIFAISKHVGSKEGKEIMLSYLLNPFILVMVLVDGHMDTVMMCFLALSILMLFRRRIYFSFFLLAMSILTKYFPIIFIPFYLVYLWEGRKNNVRYFWEIFLAFVLMAGSAALLYGPLWVGLETFSALKIVGTGFDTNTFPYIAYSVIQSLGIDISEKFFRYMSYAAFFLVYVSIFVVFVKAKDKGRALLASVFWIFAAYIFLASFQLGAWYFMWVIPFMLLMDIPSKYLLSGMMSFSALISFWKRVSFLMLVVLLLYLVVIFVTKNRRKPCIGQ